MPSKFSRVLSLVHNNTIKSFASRPVSLFSSSSRIASTLYQSNNRLFHKMNFYKECYGRLYANLQEAKRWSEFYNRPYEEDTYAIRHHEKYTMEANEIIDDIRSLSLQHQEF